MVRSTIKNIVPKDPTILLPLPVRPGKIVMCHQTFKAHGQKRPPVHRFISAPLFRGNGNSKTANIARKMANASVVKPEKRPDRKDEARQTAKFQ